MDAVKVRGNDDVSVYQVERNKIPVRVVTVAGAKHNPSGTRGGHGLEGLGTDWETVLGCGHGLAVDHKDGFAFDGDRLIGSGNRLISEVSDEADVAARRIELGVAWVDVVWFLRGVSEQGLRQFRLTLWLVPAGSRW